jgi:hypothetical protein
MDSSSSGTEIVEIADTSGVLEVTKQLLDEEGIPSTIERLVRDGSRSWGLVVSSSALEHAERVISNRKATGSLVDWDELDVGDPSTETQAELRRQGGVRVISSIIRWLGPAVVIIILCLTAIGIILSLIG